MAVRHHEAFPEHHDHHDPDIVESTTIWSGFSIAQVLALATGIFFVVTGGVGLARAGADSLTRPAVEVGPFSMTPLLALVHLALGIVALVGASGRGAARSVGFFLGPLTIAAGIIAFMEPIGELGWNEANGVAYLAIGAVGILAAVLTPATWERRVTAP